MKIVSEDKVVEGKTADLLAEWEKEKPVEVPQSLNGRWKSISDIK